MVAHLELKAMRVLVVVVFVLVSLGTASAAPIPREHDSASDPKGSDASYNAAINAERAGKTSDAIKLYDEAIHQNPENVDAVNNLGLLYMRQKHELKRAEKLFLQAIKLKPTDFNANLNYANVLAREARYSEALKQYDKTGQLVSTTQQKEDYEFDLQLLKKRSKANGRK